MEVKEPTSCLSVSHLYDGQHLLRTDAGFLTEDGRLLVLCKLRAFDGSWRARFSVVCTLYGRTVAIRDVCLPSDGIPNGWIWYLVSSDSMPHFYWIRCSHSFSSKQLLITKISLTDAQLTVTEFTVDSHAALRARAAAVHHDCLYVLGRSGDTRCLMIIDVDKQQCVTRQLQNQLSFESIHLDVGIFYYKGHLAVMPKFDRLELLNLETLEEVERRSDAPVPHFERQLALYTGFPILRCHTWFVKDDSLWLIGLTVDGECWWRLDLELMLWEKQEWVVERPSEYYNSKTYCSNSGVAVTVWRNQRGLQLTKRSLKETKEEVKTLQDLAFNVLIESFLGLIKMSNDEQRAVGIPNCYCVPSL